MQYLITFLEGIISFLSPCMLPMLPLYLSYFAGGTEEKRHHVLLRVLGFMLGFTVTFTALGLFAGTLGVFLMQYQTAVNIVGGAFVVLFGLSYLEVIRLPFFKGMSKGVQVESVFSAFLFGLIYSVSLTPCVGAFLGSALMLASTAGSAVQGAALLLTYSLGLGVPFLFSAVLLDRLNTAFQWVKQHYRVINLVCGGFLIVVGVAMMLGWMNRIMAVFS
jgi:cytochrome c-type biogenesis protein